MATKILNGYRVNIVWYEEDDLYLVYSDKLPGFSAYGDTKEEAFENAKYALGGWLASCEEFGCEIPPEDIEGMGFNDFVSKPQLKSKSAAL